MNTMSTAEKRILRGFRRNQAVIQAMIAEYHKATGKAATAQILPTAKTASKAGQSV